MSKLTYEYLVLMDSITKEYDVPFELRSTPVRGDRRIEIESVSQNICSIGSARLLHLLKPYVESITYYPSDLFYDDVHLKDTVTPKDYLGILD